MKKLISIQEKMMEVVKRLPGSGYKMGDLFTLTVGENSVKHDTREYYSGRGAKYNASIKHGNVNVTMTERELNKRYAEIAKMYRDRAKIIREAQAKVRAEKKQYELAKKEGKYALVKKEYGTFILLSSEESEGRFFDEKRLANTLHISEQDALLLNSRGKTYVFAKTVDGKILELYHSSLFVNNLSISITEVSAEHVAKFNSEEWNSAPYAAHVGATGALNHFVC